MPQGPLNAERLANVVNSGHISSLGTLDDVRTAAEELGWSEGPLRLGDPVVSELRPIEAEHAHPRSLSAIVGLGAQPLHTDGAHLHRPPDVIALSSCASSPTATRLAAAQGPAGLPQEALRHGVFVVSTGSERFYATALRDQRVRFDPGCMNPCDQRARLLVAFFAAAFDTAFRHEWTAPEGQVLVLDNRRILHAREGVAPDAGDRSLQRVAFWFQEER